MFRQFLPFQLNGFELDSRDQILTLSLGAKLRAFFDSGVLQGSFGKKLLGRRIVQDLVTVFLLVFSIFRLGPKAFWLSFYSITQTKLPNWLPIFSTFINRFFFIMWLDGRQRDRRIKTSNAYLLFLLFLVRNGKIEWVKKSRFNDTFELRRSIRNWNCFLEHGKDGFNKMEL